MKNLFLSIATLIVLSVAMVQPACATLTYEGTSTALGLDATVSFMQNGTDLKVILTNTSTADVEIPTQALSAVFFSIAGNPILTPVSAILTTGSTVSKNGDLVPVSGGNVGGEWAYLNLGSTGPDGATSGISSAGFGIFGKYNFNGPNLDGKDALNGINYGIVSMGDNPATGNADVINNPLIKNSVTFDLTLPSEYEFYTLKREDITNIQFQYGSAITDTHTHTPIPAAVWLFGTGLLGLVGIRRRIAK